MDFWIAAVIWIVLGVVTFTSLWKKFQVDWKSEAGDMKLFMICAIPLWPIALLSILGVWLKDKFF